ncbi:MAG TPA: M24 family metallopeptidase [Deltaproteobacteria bacterium]|nr:M24 family metallopeptidase [Deltaproteobacteria bacterium]
MIPIHRHADRRRLLTDRLEGPILLLGNGARARNLPMNDLPFRQDSTFLYLTGCDRPGAAALLHEGRFTLFLPRPGDDDVLWHGPGPDLGALGARYGADAVRPASELEEALGAIEAPRVLAVADEGRNRWISEQLGVPLAFGRHHGDPELVDAIIDLRRRKDPDEIAELRGAARITKLALERTMAATRPGSHERSLWTLFEAVLRIHGCGTGYDTILTQSGEILHSHHHDAPLEAGRLLLLDGGGELERSGYTVDITRTWPVSGAFTGRQRAAYGAVLEAQRAAIELCRPGVPYRQVHDASCRVLARFLVDEGLLVGDPDGVVEQGAHALFFPHGVGHHLGLDVHDLENFGDLPSYPRGKARDEAFGTANLRLDLPLQPGWVVTIEPGLYVVPAILGDHTLRDRFGDTVDHDTVASWIGFGGIRIEDDVWITDSDPELLTKVIKDPGEIEALVGTGETAEALLCGS